MQVGGRRIGSIKHDHADRRQPGAAFRSRSRSPTRRCARAPQAVDPPDLAVGHRQPLHRADARAQLGEGARRRRDARRRLDHRRRRPRPALQHARPGHAQGPAGRHPGLRRAVRGQGRAGGRGGRVLQPVPVDHAPARQPADRRTRARSTRLHRQLLARGHRRRRAPRRPRRPRRQHERDGAPRSAAENVALAQALGLLPTTLRRGQHDVRQPARDARRPRRARRRVQARDEGPRPVPARAAPARRTPRARRSATCASS